MRSLTIGVDLDDVTLEFQRRWAELYCEYFDRYVPYEALNSWDALTTNTHFENIGEFYAWFTRAGGWCNMPWIAGSRGGIDALIDAGHNVKFVTNRPGVAFYSTSEQISSTFPNQPLLFVKNKESIGCDVYVDDSPDVVQTLVQAKKRVVIFDQPWNRAVPVNPYTPQMARARDWHQVVNIINRYAETGFLREPTEEEMK